MIQSQTMYNSMSYTTMSLDPQNLVLPLNVLGILVLAFGIMSILPVGRIRMALFGVAMVVFGAIMLLVGFVMYTGSGMLLFPAMQLLGTGMLLVGALMAINGIAMALVVREMEM